MKITSGKINFRGSFIPVRIVFVWATVFAGIVVYAMAWFILGSAAMSYIDAVTEQFTFGDQWNNIVDTIKQVILWHPIISLAGWILYGFINSMKRDVDTWRV